MSDYGIANLPNPGDIVDSRWRVKRLVGSGGMGVVFEAEHVELGIRAALKYIRPEAACDRQAIERFVREARAAGIAHHPGICRVMDFVALSGQVPCLVMEFLDGEPLSDRLSRSNTIPVRESLELIIELLETLQAIHDAGIFHRDIKPQNVFCLPANHREGRTKLLDFGLARRVDASLESQLTATGAVMGTPHFLSPEQAQGLAEVGPLCDIWAMGVLLYRMLSGRLPFDGGTLTEILARILTCEPEPLRIECDPSHLLWQVVSKAMRKRPEERHSSAEAMAGELRRFVQDINPVGGSDPAQNLALARTIAPEDKPGGPGSAQGGIVSPEAKPEKATEHTGADAAAFESKGTRSPPASSKAKVAVLATVLAAAAGVGLLFGWKHIGGSGVDPDSADPDSARQKSPPIEKQARPPKGPLSAPRSTNAAKQDKQVGGPVRLLAVPFAGKQEVQAQLSWMTKILRRHVGREVQQVSAASYDDAISKLLMDCVEIATLPPQSYILAKQRDPSLVLLARYAVSYQSMILVRTRSPARGLKALAGKRFCFVDPGSTSGYLMPRKMLKDAGVDPDRDLKGIVFGKDHMNTMKSLLDGRCDAAAVSSSMFMFGWSSHVRANSSTFRILAVSEAMPGYAVVIRHDLPADLARRLEAAVQEMTRKGKGPLDPDVLVPASDRDYDVVRRLASTARGKKES